ncbi:outer membrane family protein, partial [Helicobacter heilmannii]
MTPECPTSRVLAVLLIAIHLQALDYKISGRVGSFSRIGFNNAPINTDKGLYP